MTHLLLQTAAGCETSFRELYERTSAWTYTRLHYLLRSPGHAADVTQEVYLQVWQRAASFDPVKGTAMAWINVIARRRAIDRIRALTRLAALESRSASSTHTRPTHDMGEEVVDRVAASSLRGALSCLSPIQREAVDLRYFQGRTDSEIADELSLPLGTVKTRMRDALTRLRRHLDARDYTDLASCAETAPG